MLSFGVQENALASCQKFRARSSGRTSPDSPSSLRIVLDLLTKAFSVPPSRRKTVPSDMSSKASGSHPVPAILNIFSSPVDRFSLSILKERNARGPGNTLKLNSTKTAKRPKLPTRNLGKSNPAAFFTTFPPPFKRFPAPSTKETPIRKSRNPPYRIAPGPLRPHATIPPSVDPLMEKGGSKGKYCFCSYSMA